MLSIGFQDYSVVTRSELWLQAAQAKLEKMRQIRKHQEANEFRDQSFFEHMSHSILNASRYSKIESKLPQAARASSRSSLKSREGSRSRESIYKAKKASAGYSQIHDLRREYLQNSHLS